MWKIWWRYKFYLPEVWDYITGGKFRRKRG